MKKIRVLIADDHAIVRDGLQQLLKNRQDMEVAGEAEDGHQALERAKALRPDVVLLDIAMPRLSGIEVIGLIRSAVPDSQVVVLSMHAKETYVQQALAAGALGYVLKASPSQDILDAIKAAQRGEYFLSSRLQAEVIGKYLKAQQSVPSVRSYDLLSEREQQVFRLVAQGRSTNQIADILCVSPKTVEKHRTSLMNKLNVHDRLDLLKYAIKIGIVDPDLWED
ncbi:MAG: response regulator transcription factor [Deltaproteobacteria bacterium]|jgi:DNA-binding NarL/FixJ family response regulator|nr:response regulator transcription factor [Deltaproteobacteria bacterium]